jgi:hypothetical protein
VELREEEVRPLVSHLPQIDLEEEDHEKTVGYLLPEYFLLKASVWTAVTNVGVVL